MKYYITKYALTKGILELDGGIYENRVILDSMSFSGKKDFHETLGDAMIRAEEMLSRKIKSLNREIDKFKKFEFEVKKSLV